MVLCVFKNNMSGVRSRKSGLGEQVDWHPQESPEKAGSSHPLFDS